MFAGAGLESLAMLQGQSRASGGASAASNAVTYQQYSNISVRTTEVSAVSLLQSTQEDSLSTSLVDQIVLSDAAQEQLADAKAALETLESAKDNFSEKIKARLEKLQDSISAITEALSGGETNDLRTLLKETEQIGKDLRYLGKKMGVIGPRGHERAAEVASVRSLEVRAVSLTASFNSIAQIENEDGSITQIEQSQDIELSYVQVAYSESRNSAVKDFEFPKDVRDDFLLTAKGFMDLISEFEEFFSSEDRFPPSLSQVIRDIIGSTLEVDNSDSDSGASAGDGEHLVDQAA